MQKIYGEIAAKKNTFKSLEKVYGPLAPEECLAKSCFRDVTEDPIPGMHGYISLKNLSEFDIDVRIKIELDQAFMVYPEKSTKEKFIAAIQ